MKKFLILIGVIILISCSDNQAENAFLESESVVLSESYYPKVNNFHIQPIDETEYVIIPLGHGEKDAKIISGRKNHVTGYWNLVFYNSLTQQSRLLTQDKLLILNYELPEISHKDSLKSKDLILYTIVNQDFNQDKEFTGADPHSLYLSDRLGNNFRQISPKNHNLRNWKYIPLTQTIFMQTTKDTNADREFNDQDSTFMYVYSIRQNQPAKPIFNQEFKNLLNENYQKHWGKK